MNTSYSGGSSHNIITNHFYLGMDNEGLSINEWKDKLKGIIENIPEEADKLTPIIQLIVSAISPAKIYMLKHKPFKGSDATGFIDLLIVIPSSCNIKFTELEPTLEMAYLKDSRVCCSLLSESAVIDGLKEGHIYYSLYCTPENIVYDDKKNTYPIAPVDLLTEMKNKQKENFASQFKRAKNFYQCASFLHSSDDTTLVLFMLHQAIELTYRAVMKSLDYYEKRTHQIRSMRKYVRRSAPELNLVFTDDTPQERRLLDVIENAYLGTRYEDHYEIKEGYTELLLEKVSRLQDIAEQTVNEILN
ncbi:HEPN domain-containing protein [Filimonas effusa]|nr:HEPN domain-containing protein [Filimonas effusa]